ncbi:MAG: hypothetical protein M5U26_27560 [Planctomycetota bacterium]|nr:hypothetical protein [Planctomycetota bacterium]
MTDADRARGAFVAWKANADFSEAAVLLADGTRLFFRHRLRERKAFAAGPDGRERELGEAGALLQRIAIFRLNAKHLDVTFRDESRWELDPQAALPLKPTDA